MSSRFVYRAVKFKEKKKRKHNKRIKKNTKND